MANVFSVVFIYWALCYIHEHGISRASYRLCVTSVTKEIKSVIWSTVNGSEFGI